MKRLLARRWKHGLDLPSGGKTPPLKELYISRDGNLPKELWEALEVEFLADSKTISHDLAHLAALARADALVQKLESVQKGQCIDKKVDAYIRKELPFRKDKNGKQTNNVNQPHLVEVRCSSPKYMPRPTNPYWLPACRCCFRWQW